MCQVRIRVSVCVHCLHSFMCVQMSVVLFPETLFIFTMTVSSRTLEQRAKRLFSTKDVPLSALDSSMFAKSKSSDQEVQKNREIAALEALVYKYSELLGVSSK